MSIMRYKPFRSLERWDPFKEFQSLADRFTSLFDEIFPFEWKEETVLSRWSPAIDIYETDEDIVVSAEVPGMDKKDIEVNVVNNVLTLKGEKKLDKEIKKENFHRIERCYGSFSRTFTLPDYVETDNIKASFKNGLLEIKIPKKPAAKPKEIKIE